MHSLKILAVAIAAAVAPLAYGQAQSPSGSAIVGTAPGKGLAMQHVKATATVEATDPAKRTVTLKNARGEVRTITAGPEVRNFDQIKVGDSVTIEYVEGLALELKKDGKAVLGRSEVKSLERSDPGMKPGGMATREITAVADVVNVDAKKSTVTVKNKEGETFDLNIRDPEQLKLIKKGDQIQATYTEAVAVSLKPAPAAAPKKK
jgi:Cu/Ag efflux protein CusF